MAKSKPLKLEVGCRVRQVVRVVEGYVTNVDVDRTALASDPLRPRVLVHVEVPGYETRMVPNGDNAHAKKAKPGHAREIEEHVDKEVFVLPVLNEDGTPALEVVEAAPPQEEDAG